MIFSHEMAIRTWLTSLLETENFVNYWRKLRQQIEQLIAEDFQEREEMSEAFNSPSFLSKVLYKFKNIILLNIMLIGSYLLCGLKIHYF